MFTGLSRRRMSATLRMVQTCIKGFNHRMDVPWRNRVIPKQGYPCQQAELLHVSVQDQAVGTRQSEAVSFYEGGLVIRQGQNFPGALAKVVDQLAVRDRVQCLRKLDHVLVNKKTQC